MLIIMTTYSTIGSYLANYVATEDLLLLATAKSEKPKA